jgi:hypothetical protein
VPSMKRFIQPSSSQESALRESHEAGRFHTARVKTGKSRSEQLFSGLPPDSGMSISRLKVVS